MLQDAERFILGSVHPQLKVTLSERLVDAHESVPVTVMVLLPGTPCTDCGLAVMATGLPFTVNAAPETFDWFMLNESI